MGWNVGDEVAVVWPGMAAGTFLKRRVARVWKNGICLLEGDDTRKFRPDGTSTGDMWRKPRIYLWSDEWEERKRLAKREADLRRRRIEVEKWFMGICKRDWDDKLLLELEELARRWQSVDGA